jgi:hypothetical protein
MSVLIAGLADLAAQSGKEHARSAQSRTGRAPVFARCHSEEKAHAVCP